MPLLASQVARRYKFATAYPELQHAWRRFSEWIFKYLEESLVALSDAIGPSPVQRKAAVVSALKATHGALVAKYSSRMAVLDPVILQGLRLELLRDLKPWCRIHTAWGFAEEEIWSDVDHSQAYATLKRFDRDRIIDRIVELPANTTAKDVVWLKSLDLAPYKDVVQRISSTLPDFEPKPGDEGSFEAFEGWVKDLPGNLEDWEDALPILTSDNLVEHLGQTRLGTAISNLLGTSYFFPALQEVAQDLKALLLKTKTG